MTPQERKLLTELFDRLACGPLDNGEMIESAPGDKIPTGPARGRKRERRTLT